MDSTVQFWPGWRPVTGVQGSVGDRSHRSHAVHPEGVEAGSRCAREPWRSAATGFGHHQQLAPRRRRERRPHSYSIALIRNVPQPLKLTFGLLQSTDVVGLELAPVWRPFTSMARCAAKAQCMNATRSLASIRSRS